LALDKEGFEKMIDRMGPHVKIMTISPSQESSKNNKAPCARIKSLLARGIVPSLGHDTQCHETEILECLKAGSDKKDNPHDIRFHITHAFNVTKFHHRDSGLANFAMVSQFPDSPEFEGIRTPTIEVIGDGRHVSLMTLAGVLAARDPESICFITDAIAEPSPGKIYDYGDGVEVAHHGECCYLRGTSTLAGSCTNLHETLIRLVNVLRVPLS
jgi:N-acetylglucosamine-6-phosphate deacetylase